MPACADVVWDGDGVLGHIWLVAGLAFAFKGQGLGVAGVGVGGHGAFFLAAELRAGGGLVRTPCCCLNVRNRFACAIDVFIVRGHTLGLDVDGLWVNPVLLLGLNGGSKDGDEPGDLKSQHVDCIKLTERM